MSITYGTRTVLADISRLHSLADGAGVAFGEINNSAGAHGINIHLTIPINSSATGGTYDVYLLESQDGAEWTDGIDPATSGDQSAKLSDATLIHQSDTVYNASNRANAVIHEHIPMISSAQYIGIFVVNNSGQTTPASGADGDSVAYTVA